MMSALTRKHEEAKRLLECYVLHKNSPDIEMRRKVHLDLDRFLMEKLSASKNSVHSLNLHPEKKVWFIFPRFVTKESNMWKKY